jgi:hypothetical protein
VQEERQRHPFRPAFLRGISIKHARGKIMSPVQSAYDIRFNLFY